MAGFLKLLLQTVVLIPEILTTLLKIYRILNQKPKTQPQLDISKPTLEVANEIEKQISSNPSARSNVTGSIVRKLPEDN